MERRRKVVPRRAKKETDNNTFLMGLVRNRQAGNSRHCLKNGVRARAEHRERVPVNAMALSRRLRGHFFISG